VPQVPPALIDQLQQDGRLVAIVGDGLAAAATLFVRSADGVSGRSVFNAPAPRLPGFDRPRTFSF
jgi:protein-L-isoaspartate(D-aspartate) O-methyltransferase